MTIQLSRETRNQAVASIERYFKESLEQRIGNVAAGGLLGFFLEEIGPAICNQAVADVQVVLVHERDALGPKHRQALADGGLEAHGSAFLKGLTVTLA